MTKKREPVWGARPTIFLRTKDPVFVQITYGNKRQFGGTGFQLVLARISLYPGVFLGEVSGEPG
jgi:hypothetical protein